MNKHTLAGTESGWWFVCFAGRLWLPQGDIPRGAAQQFGLTGKLATPIGEWQGGSCLVDCGKNVIRYGIPSRSGFSR
ncbi:NADH pyrophosphatase [Providencia alcalifaciens]|nr:NADH pyrophosphatase [Providencia alcalifaciens]